MAIYHFSSQYISRGKGQSATAAAAYRSGEKLYSERYGKFNDYRREIKPVSFILAPPHAPKWATDREELWNRVEQKEKQKNAQLAREINIALPKELSFEEQEKLTREYCQKIFVDDGMIADISIHLDDKNNPHFHVMLTLRSLNEQGEFEAKVKKVKQEYGNPIRTELTDWNSREKFSMWRREWANLTNRYLAQNGFDERITEKSHEALAKETLPTIHEGPTARKMGDRSDRVTINKEVQKHNENVLDLQQYREELKQEKERQDVVRALTPKEKKNLRLIAQDLKIFVSFGSINEKKKMVQRWERSVLKDESNPAYSETLNKIHDIRLQAEKADDILRMEAERFLTKHYPSIDESQYTPFAKKILVEEAVHVKRMFTTEEAETVLANAMDEEMEETLSVLMLDKIYSYGQIDQKHKTLQSQAENLMAEKELVDQNKDPERYQKVMAKGKSVAAQMRGCEVGKSVIEHHYNQKMKKLYEEIPGELIKQLPVTEKELIVGYADYFGERLDYQDQDPIVQQLSAADKKEIIDLLTDASNKENANEKFVKILSGNATIQQFFFAECMGDVSLLNNEEYAYKLALLVQQEKSEGPYVSLRDTRKPGTLTDLITVATSSLTRSLDQLDYEDREKIQEMNRLQRAKRRETGRGGLGSR